MHNGSVVTVIELRTGFCIRVGGKPEVYFDDVEEGRRKVQEMYDKGKELNKKAKALNKEKFLSDIQLSQVENLLDKLEERINADRQAIKRRPAHIGAAKNGAGLRLITA